MATIINNSDDIQDRGMGVGITIGLIVVVLVILVVLAYNSPLFRRQFSPIMVNPIASASPTSGSTVNVNVQQASPSNQPSEQPTVIQQIFPQGQPQTQPSTAATPLPSPTK
ncbi:hypothetical protein C5B42_04370 [Candidatus Cerribacteria bacterium 'Amazon FNV 2010 28 9']|uniref:Uncharacterized protein n=1 Tax=Candidatus Cerribacteria bacterium 'Amazon FNV 2010 28 9' TaxID=2081795 RepID=A0A317JMW5_9BACT|nr:MAG: hypothetical protein C5B42_04370 [Candidatus Cerribacteria bacterium 'Amazon FNV 2010 28 9']